jgi:hypothetical protein
LVVVHIPAAIARTIGNMIDVQAALFIHIDNKHMVVINPAVVLFKENKAI